MKRAKGCKSAEVHNMQKLSTLPCALTVSGLIFNALNYPLSCSLASAMCQTDHFQPSLSRSTHSHFVKLSLRRPELWKPPNTPELLSS
eukprot:3063283-Amphidinium_carterae.1